MHFCQRDELAISLALTDHHHACQESAMKNKLARLQIGCTIQTPYGQGKIIAIRKLKNDPNKGKDVANLGEEEEKEADNVVLPSQITPEVIQASGSELCVTV